MTIEYVAQCPFCPFEITDDNQPVIMKEMQKHCKINHNIHVTIDKNKPYSFRK